MYDLFVPAHAQWVENVRSTYRVMVASTPRPRPLLATISQLQTRTPGIPGVKFSRCSKPHCRHLIHDITGRLFKLMSRSKYMHGHGHWIVPLSLRMDDVCICTDIHMSYTEIIANVTLPGNMSVTGAIIKKINDKEGMEMFARYYFSSAFPGREHFVTCKYESII